MANADEQAEHEAQAELHAQGRQAAIDLLLNKGLYSFISTDSPVGAEVERQITGARIGTFDCFCVECKQVTPFIVTTIIAQTMGGGLRGVTRVQNPPQVQALRSVCQRCINIYLYTFRKLGDRFIKIGQHPSMADISFGELKDIEKGLDELDRKELGTALGLFAHDAASGAFTYLRRVFERMIRRAYECLGEKKDPVDYEGLRWDEKIEALKDSLPDVVVENKKVFSLLSKGIHELTDEQCKLMFPVVKSVIFQMLEQEEHKRKKAAAAKATAAALGALLADHTATDAV